jgi:Trk-type K+ transport system membrane component
MEFMRLGVVYAHLIACCIAIGLILTSDLRMLKQIFKGETFDQDNAAHFASLQSTVSNALVALWITGAVIIGLDVSDKGFAYFSNPKIQAKIALVILLTLNGFVLHAAVLPALSKAGSLLKLAPSKRRLAVFSGAVSAVTWLYAAMLGVGRPLAWKYSLLQLLCAYPFLIAGGFALMTFVIAWARNGVGTETESFARS